MARSSSNIDVALRLRGARKFAKEVDRAGKDLEKMGFRGAESMAKFANQSQKLKDFGKGWTKNVTLPIVAGGAASVMAAAKWESAFAGVRKTVDATESEFAALERGIRDMSMQIPTSANDLAAIAASAGQLGIETDNILKFTRVIADLGEATNLVGEEGAQQLARFANIMQMPQSEFDRLGSTIVDLGNNFATTEADIVRMGLRLAGAGKQVGLTEANVMALATAMSSVGIEAEAGGTAMSQVMTDMLSAVLGGGKKLRQFAKVAGMSKGDFGDLFGNNPAEAIQTFVAGLGRIKAEGGDVTGTLKDMGLGGQRMVRMLLSLSGAGGVLSDALVLGGKAWEENNALTKEAQARYETFESRLKILKNTLTDLGVTVGNVLLPPLTDLADKLGPVLINMAEAFGSMPPALQIATLGALGFVAAVGPLVWILGTLAGSVGKLLVMTNLLAGSWKSGRLHALRFNFALIRMRAVMGAKALLGAVTALTRGFIGLTIAMLTNPIFLLITGLALLAVGFVVAYHKIEWFRNAVDATWDAITGGVKDVVEWLRSNWKQVLFILTAPIVALPYYFVTNFDEIVDLAAGLGGKMADAAVGMFDWLIDAFQDALDWIVEKLEELKSSVEDVIPSPLRKALGISVDVGGAFAKGFGLPGLAAGGTTLTGGSVLVGERGPEILTLPPAARVTPLDHSGLGDGLSGIIEIVLHSNLYVDGERMAQNTARHVADHGARR